MIGAARIETRIAVRTPRMTSQILIYGKPPAAISAQDRLLIKFLVWPRLGGMACFGAVAFKTREPLPAAFEFDCDDVFGAVPMAAARFAIDLDTVNFYSVDITCHALYVTLCASAE